MINRTWLIPVLTKDFSALHSILKEDDCEDPRLSELYNKKISVEHKDGLFQ